MDREGRPYRDCVSTLHRRYVPFPMTRRGDTMTVLSPGKVDRVDTLEPGQRTGETRSRNGRQFTSTTCFWEGHHLENSLPG